MYTVELLLSNTNIPRCVLTKSCGSDVFSINLAQSSRCIISSNYGKCRHGLEAGRYDVRLPDWLNPLGLYLFTCQSAISTY